MAAAQDQSPADVRDGPGADATGAIALPLAALLHAAVLGICALAVYSTAVAPPIDWAERHPEGNPILAVLVAVAVLIPIIGLRARLAQRASGKLVLALGLAYVFRLAIGPLMPAALLGGAAETYQVSWANVGLLVLLIAWCLCLLGAGRGSLAFTGLECAVAATAVGLCALVIVLLLAVGKQYEADASYAITLIIKAAQYTIICIVAGSVSGTRRVGAWFHAYVLAALAAALVLSMPGGGAEDEYSLWGTLV
ncbi:MAG: hypothetical protein ACE5JM_12030 [Armatimonadota bacterium]